MNEFYVGYVPHAPDGLARFVRRVVLTASFVTIATGAALLVGQMPQDAKTFEYGTVKQREGTIVATPYPALIPTGGGAPFLLVAPGKHGFRAGELLGQRVRLDGTLIQFGENRMLQVVSGNAVDGVPAGIAPEESLGRMTLEGEIVDTKCFFGVMQPGSGKVHRACAARCIAGGIPPGLLVRESDGRLRTILLVSRGDIKSRVAERVRLDGTLVRTAAGIVFRSDY